MTAFALRGWCPGAWRPMMAGDGLLVRVKPRLARLTRHDVEVLADVSHRFGSGAIDITNRANLQIRGVGEDDWPKLLGALVAAGLVEGDSMAETRRSLLVAPDWLEGDDTCSIATELLDRLDEFPQLPDKFGIGVDAGPTPMLAACPADLRIERAARGGLLLRLDGRDTGMAVRRENAVDRLRDLAHWFVETGGRSSGRASRHCAALPDWAGGTDRPAVSRSTIPPPEGYGVPFGQTQGRALVRLMDATGAVALRITPWRRLVPEAASFPDVEGFIRDSGDPLLRTDACPGAPLCPQSRVETRELASRLAPYIEGRLHVSGCAKGCARSRPSAVVLTGGDGTFDLAFDARPGDPPTLAGLTPDRILDHFGAC
ncbi:cobalamin biosynthesis protein CobG [Novosphingobium sp. ZW T3_23]|uniref:cobalamin biosynthesis protein CobG n=1 Tax=Novosphingobium sp. ZW T3_23 TaxID=3378084 RepID=UPI003852B3C9